MLVASEQSSTHRYPQYQAYLLRLWQEAPDAQWRVQLQLVGTDQMIGFPTPESCFAFIRGQLCGDERVGKDRSANESIIM